MRRFQHLTKPVVQAHDVPYPVPLEQAVLARFEAVAQAEVTRKEVIG